MVDSPEGKRYSNCRKRLHLMLKKPVYDMGKKETVLGSP